MRVLAPDGALALQDSRRDPEQGTWTVIRSCRCGATRHTKKAILVSADYPTFAQMTVVISPQEKVTPAFASALANQPLPRRVLADSRTP